MESRATILDLVFDLSRRYPHATIYYGKGKVCEHHLNVVPTSLYQSVTFQKNVDEMLEVFREAFIYSTISFNDNIEEMWTHEPQFTVQGGKVRQYKSDVARLAGHYNLP